MKTLILLIGAILSFAFITTSNPKNKSYSIQELISNPNYIVSTKSNGGHSSNSVMLSIRSNSNKDISLYVPEGTLFYPANENEQTLVTPREKMIAINKNKDNNIALHGFCTEASDRSPKSGGNFKTGTNKNEKLVKLLQFFKTHKGISKHAVQEAIWCVTDNESIAHVYTDDPEIDKKLKKALSEITGQKIPWHTKKRKIETNSNGYIVATPVEVKGEVTFSTTKKTTVKSKVINEAGEVVFPNDNNLEIPRALTNIKLDFKVRVNGWAKGKYYVIYYTTEGKTILKKEFTI